MTKRMTFILGGARSGKSTYAQNLAAQRGGRVLYAATAEAGDDEMRVRIAAHQAERPPDWQTVEAPKQVGMVLLPSMITADVVLLDCITLLTSNVLLSLPESATVDEVQQEMDREVDGLLTAFEHGKADWIVVSNEVGLGLVPAYALGRTYRDVLGRVNQRLAQVADEVVFMVAGLPLKVK
ncbi:MAG: bifunctional adenosylcobinamide kinase/adenosylcobinamide-phosphate guanylyltransferase [Anaerolineaceae bacterium]|jgi:adenosylcobinamide kinase/adenosylcobinamide-phosphate guanylyltransferase|nr:bifunctional adenosylcobinamide kinase/adenosylcobinamide-phosphate guanylyltransferase [Anaerolineaceae bacterium]